MVLEVHCVMSFLDISLFETLNELLHHLYRPQTQTDIRVDVERCLNNKMLKELEVQGEEVCRVHLNCNKLHQALNILLVYKLRKHIVVLKHFYYFSHRYRLIQPLVPFECVLVVKRLNPIYSIISVFRKYTVP